MNRYFFTLFLSLAVMIGSASASGANLSHDRGNHREFASKSNERKDNRHGTHNSSNRGKFDKTKDPKKYDRNKDPKKYAHNKHDKEFKKHLKEREKWEKQHHKQYKHHDNRFSYRGKYYYYPENLAYMARRAAGPGQVVDVWMVDPQTYVVKYRHGNRFYTRSFHPYTGRYDAPALISVNWNPLSGWLQVPPIQININL